MFKKIIKITTILLFSAIFINLTKKKIFANICLGDSNPSCSSSWCCEQFEGLFYQVCNPGPGHTYCRAEETSPITTYNCSNNGLDVCQTIQSVFVDQCKTTHIPAVKECSISPRDECSTAGETCSGYEVVLGNCEIVGQGSGFCDNSNGNFGLECLYDYQCNEVITQGVCEEVDPAYIECDKIYEQIGCCYESESPVPTPTGSGGGGGGPTNTPTPYPTTVPQSPKGSLDAAYCINGIKGWTCDPDNYSTQLTVKFYDEDSTLMGQKIESGTRPDVASVCGGATNHGYVYPMPESYKDGTEHEVTAVSQNIGSGANRYLNSPQTFTCYSQKSCNVSVSAPFVSGDDGPDISASGTSDETSNDTTNLVLRRSDNGKIYPLPKYYNGSSWVNATETNYDNRYYYQLSTCTSKNGNTCQISTSLRNIDAGNYTVHCDMKTFYPDACLGNPNCSHNSSSYANVSCDAWQDCGDNDWTSFTMIEPTPAPTLVPCGSSGCVNSDDCESSLDCIDTSDGFNKYCTVPDYSEYCADNPNYINCCVEPTPTTVPPTPTPTPFIQGSFYEEGATACTGSTPVTLDANSSISSFDGASTYNGTIDGATYTLSAPDIDGSYDVTLDLTGQVGGETTWACACPYNDSDFVCYYSDQTHNPDNDYMTLDFHLTNYDLSNVGWWQVAGGNLYANTNIISFIPNTTCEADASCYAGMITKYPFADTTENLAGFPITNTGTTDTHKDGDDQQSYIHVAGASQAENAFATNTTIPTENYDFFYSKFGADASDVSGYEPDLPPNANSTNIFKLTGNGEGNVRIDETQGWNVPSGQTYLIFVDGDLEVADSGEGHQVITVDSGGFLAFIVSGNITFDSSVGHTSATTNPANNSNINVEGVFIADGQMIFETNGQADTADRKFIGAGSFVGWSEIDMQRTFADDALGGVNNNTNPAEVIIYRPDFIINTPIEMKVAHYAWREIPPEGE
jgi:hypothetical protein